MKFAINLKFIPAFLVFGLMILSFGCSGSSSSASVKGTPTEAYKRLFDAVKSKDTEKIKAVMSKSTIAFAESNAKRTNQTMEQMLKNGLMATTLAPTLPPTRDERVKDNFGAVEVYNMQESKWEDIPFIGEDGEWKLAVGDLWANTWKQPAKGRAVLEMEAANASGNGVMVVNTNGVGNFVSAPRTAKTDGLPANSNSNVAVAPQSNKAK